MPFCAAVYRHTAVESTLDGVSLNLTNTTSTYEFFCRKCEIEQQLKEQDPLTPGQIQIYILGGWLLCFIEVVLLHFLRHRHNLIYRFHGASRPSNMPVLLLKLDEHFVRNQERGKKRLDGHLVSEETITVNHEYDDGGSSSDEDDDVPLIARSMSADRQNRVGQTAADTPTRPEGEEIDQSTTPQSAQNLSQFLDHDITNSPTDKKKKKLEKQKERAAKRGDDDSDERSGEEKEMMHFSNAQKDADDVLSYRLFIWLCSITKMVMLFCCMYIAFYQWHYSLRVNQALMKWNKGYGQGEEIELTPWGTDGSADRCIMITACLIDSLYYHVMALMPAALLIFVVLPKVSRRISLLVGVLHLHDDALQITVAHMETIENVRNRIIVRLEATTVVRGKPRLQKGLEMLDKLRAGEVELLHKLASIDEEHHQRNIKMSYNTTDEHRERWSGVDWSNVTDDVLGSVIKIQRALARHRFFIRMKMQMHAQHLENGKSRRQLGKSRVSRKQALELLDQQETQTETDELVKFLSREEFQEYLLKNPAYRETALGAKSLRLDPTDPQKDTILVSEFGTFLVRAIADVVNVASECGVAWKDIKTFEDEVIKFGAATKMEFVNARRMARSKALFYNMSHDSESVSYKQLWKGLKRYRVSITKQELNVICPIIDPDQTRSITLEEWLDFALASDDNLCLQALRSAEIARNANAAKGSQQGGLMGMFVDISQYSREAIAALPLGEVVLATIEHPIDTAKGAVQGVQELAEMEANDALAVVAGIDKQRKKIVSEFQPMCVCNAA
eukprot:COSAG02_NODE_3288_length_7000_cov_1414.390958_6_plen_789_part_00